MNFPTSLLLVEDDLYFLHFGATKAISMPMNVSEASILGSQQSEFQF
jgi:hypothetical protein